MYVRFTNSTKNIVVGVETVKMLKQVQHDPKYIYDFYIFVNLSSYIFNFEQKFLILVIFME